jgi:tetratricopeptide (TPR) repeat protein
MTTGGYTLNCYDADDGNDGNDTPSSSKMIVPISSRRPRVMTSSSVIFLVLLLGVFHEPSLICCCNGVHGLERSTSSVGMPVRRDTSTFLHSSTSRFTTSLTTVLRGGNLEDGSSAEHENSKESPMEGNDENGDDEKTDNESTTKDELSDTSQTNGDFEGEPATKQQQEKKDDDSMTDGGFSLEVDESMSSSDENDVVVVSAAFDEIDEAKTLAFESATKLRLEGKELHDQGNFVKAAALFQTAADTLLEHDESTARTSEEYATCRLHQALCYLKSENYELCLEACTDVLQDADGQSGEVDETTATTTIAKTPSKPTFATNSPAVKARAYHRRAKAKLGLGDTAGALQDARSAAFLGDGKAVALYGKLMRESSASDISSALNPLLSSQSSTASSSHTALLESLMNKSFSSAGSGGFPGFSPASLLMGSGNGGGNNLLGALGSGAGGGLAKSVVQNLSKRLDDAATQEQICNFLQKTSKTQLKSFAAMVGVNDDVIQDSHLDRIVNFCHGVTPKGIRRTVKTTKVTVYIVKVTRRIFKLINKYKSLLAAIIILQWTKSATLRPIPINKKAARQAAKQALKEAMKTSRAGFF